MVSSLNERQNLTESSHEISNRENFLKHVWRAYPAMPLDQSEWPAKACGRLRIDNSASTAAVMLETIEGHNRIEFTPNCRWLGVAPEATPFDATVLRSGDIVMIGGCEDANGSFLASICQLLTPCRSALPQVSNFDIARSRQWMNFIARVRQFFTERGFIELLTPTLVVSPGTEPFLEPMRVQAVYNGREVARYLPTSPEFHLKKALARGWREIFEIKTCFRNGEAGTHHQPEFSMLEWYRAYARLDAIEADLQGLLWALARSESERAHLQLKRISVRELFSKLGDVEFDLQPTTTRDQLAELASRLSVRTALDDSFDDIYFRIFLECVEPMLVDLGPVVVYDYPPSQAALARIGANGFAERFELYWRGLEIANAFHELNDPEQNRERFALDAKIKMAQGKAAVPIDDELLNWLDYGLPPSGGIALGLDRLFMAWLEIDSIEDTRAFSF